MKQNRIINKRGQVGKENKRIPNNIQTGRKSYGKENTRKALLNLMRTAGKVLNEGKQTGKMFTRTAQMPYT